MAGGLSLIQRTDFNARPGDFLTELPAGAAGEEGSRQVWVGSWVGRAGADQAGSDLLTALLLLRTVLQGIMGSVAPPAI